MAAFVEAGNRNNVVTETGVIREQDVRPAEIGADESRTVRSAEGSHQSDKLGKASNAGNTDLQMLNINSHTMTWQEYDRTVSGENNRLSRSALPVTCKRKQSGK